MTSVLLSSSNPDYSQDFDTLSASGTNPWTNNITISGWYATETQFIASNGTNASTQAKNTGINLFSFVNGADRALGTNAQGLGTLPSTNRTYFGVRFRNNDSNPITSVNFSYFVEQWSGGNPDRQPFNLQFQVNSPSLTSGTWSTIITHSAPVTGGAVRSLDGNSELNRIFYQGEILATLEPGDELWLRWEDQDDRNFISGATIIPDPVDASFAIDDFSLNATFASSTTGQSFPGTSGNNTITGTSGNDTIDGLGGADSLLGNEGNDTINGGLNNDTIVGGDGKDTLLGGNGADSILGGTGNDSISGGNGNDISNGDAGDDTIQGDAGNDLLYGGVGDDSLAGGTGNDTIYGGFGADTVLGGKNTDSLFGEDGNDSIDGGLASDTIFGGTGDDTLIGGKGLDTLTGDLGRDSFQFNDTISGADTINDFEPFIDRFLISSSGFAGTSPGTLPATAFVSGPGVNTATNPDHRFIYNTTNGQLRFDPNGNTGAPGATLIATLTTTPSISNFDIVIF